jgi:pyruvate,water dikinase
MKILELFSTKKSCRLLVNLEGDIVEKYKYFKEFLGQNYQALNALAELEQIYYTGAPFSMGVVEKLCRELLACVRQLARALDGLGGGRYGTERVLDRLERELAPVLPCALLPDRGPGPAVVRPDAGVLLTPGQGHASRILATSWPYPFPGFVVTACAFGRFLEEAG